MDMATRIQILKEAVCIPHSASTFGEKYESNYSSSSYEQIVGLTWLVNPGMTTDLGEGKINLNLLNSAEKLHSTDGGGVE